MSERLTFASYPVFRADRARFEEIDRDVAVKEVTALLESTAVETRGIYSTASFSDPDPV